MGGGVISGTVVCKNEHSCLLINLVVTFTDIPDSFSFFLSVYCFLRTKKGITIGISSTYTT